ncbi:MAG: hypothetical protein A3H35_10495 [Betaproteobacteria bacterium RIFCSPLOWO2_02_FULL_62_17]|nr:MAG: hypothetical protein A3H35_10495 [Betaproteobacteria bacterium RIFCSPLOWO2_02_FULL_62_17]
MPRPPLRSLVLICAAVSGAAVQAAATAADFSPQVWLNPGIYSFHFDRDSGHRANNIGIGAEVLVTDDHALMAGSFINSDRQRSLYGLYEWRPLHWQISGVKLSAGIAAGAFDGYPKYHNGGWFAAALPLLAVEGARVGVNLALIPNIPNRLSGALAIQVKLRVW